MDVEIWLAILGTVTALVGAQIKTTQWFMKRLETRDERIDRLITELSEAVRAFRVFEEEEKKSHEEIFVGLTKLTEAQRGMIRELERIEHRLDRASFPPPPQPPPLIRPQPETPADPRST